MADTVEFQKQPRKRRPFAELSVASLRHVVTSGERSFPAGTKATVVAVYGDGDGYEVEVFTSFHAVLTVGTDDLAE